MTKLVIRYWQPVLLRGWLRPLTPLAGILFIIEEMRPQFRYTLISIKAVFIGVIMSTIMYRIFNHEVALIDVGKLSDAPLNTLWLYLILGIILAFSALF